MGLLDGLKQVAANITSGAAKVHVFPANPAVVQGATLHIVVTAASTGQEVKHDGVYIDLVGNETITAKGPTGSDVSMAKQTFSQAYKIAPAGSIAANAAAQFVGEVQVPPGLPVSYQGPQAKHEITINARLDMTGSDPQSGAQAVIVLRKP